MSTLFQIYGDLPAGTSKLQAGDYIPVHEASSGRVKRLSGDLIGGAASTPVNTTATTLALTQAAHAGRVVTVSASAPAAITLPASAGTGDKYTLQIQVAATATGHTVKVANTTDIMQGLANLVVATNNSVLSYPATATDDTITINGGTKGGAAGDLIELTDVKTGFWSVKYNGVSTGSTGTPFSATV